MNNLPRICWTVSACLAFIEAIWGLKTILIEGSSIFPTYSYVNLLSWFSLALYGTYYRISRRHFDGIDKTQVLFAVLGAVAMASGTVIDQVGGPHLPALIGSAITTVAIGLFAYITVSRPLRLLAVS
ncbi:hypothetical protein [Thalassospira mesophila]|uniref:Uncharacterized protein n=1 Tax=Thalassospira mesophila TaxID=1293891 RepID=A0A1Y2L2X6_9PROT|nr:hypothetical protein [Thalassospira mesophila]OSQ39527.1 hypothetical protein TMES_05755 [Thalassospira mesophila]